MVENNRYVSDLAAWHIVEIRDDEARSGDDLESILVKGEQVSVTSSPSTTPWREEEDIGQLTPRLVPLVLLSPYSTKSEKGEAEEGRGGFSNVNIGLGPWFAIAKLAG